MALIDAPWWYWLAALLVSVWHAFRGCWYYSLDKRFADWRTRDRVIVLYVQATWLYFTSSAAGFATLIVAYRMATSPEPDSVSAGQAALIALAFLFGFLGVSGELPQLVQRGKFPSTK